jgi:hypothetical protein
MSSIKFGSPVGLHVALSSNDTSQIFSVKWLGFECNLFFQAEGV